MSCKPRDVTLLNIGMLSHNDITMAIESRAAELFLSGRCYLTPVPVIFYGTNYFPDSRNRSKYMQEREHEITVKKKNK